MITQRNLLLALGLVLSGATAAQQQYFLNISGHHTPCDAAVQSSFVHLVSLPGTIPDYDIEVPINTNCYYTVTLELNSLQYGFVITSGCASIITTAITDSLITPPPMGTVLPVVVDFNCSNQQIDCLGVPGGPAVQGTPCTTFLNEPGVFDANCACIPFSSACTACFTVVQDTTGNGPTPFVANLFSCSGSVGGDYTLNWDAFSVGNATGESAQFTFPGPGAYEVCLWMVGNTNNCTSTFCDSVFVDANGNISTGQIPVFDCLQIPNGPNMPGTPCVNPATGEFGTWSADCICVPDTNTTGCQAGFWVIQAYEPDSLNPGSATPIPYELWVWNLSTGTSPFQFEWDFGDGTSSFDPYPTHEYGASGPYNLCLTLSDAASCTSVYCDEVSIDGDGFYEGMAPENEVRNGFTIHVINQLPAAVPEQRFDDSRVWPNPVTDALNLSFRSTVSGNVPVSIIDLNGRMIRQESLAFVRGGNSISLNAADLPAGLYLLRVGNDTNTMNIRFVKQ
ncbi:MAG: T9SS type A sorting domain-containing protein [Flavobacteriales bacterium]